MSEWNKVDEIPFGGYKCDIRLLDGEIIKDCAHMGGEFYFTHEGIRQPMASCYVKEWRHSVEE